MIAGLGSNELLKRLEPQRSSGGVQPKGDGAKARASSSSSGASFADELSVQEPRPARAESEAPVRERDAKAPQGDDEDVDLTRFKKIERPSAKSVLGTAAVVRPLSAVDRDGLTQPVSEDVSSAAAAAAAGATFFGPFAPRRAGVESEGLDVESRAETLELFREEQAQVRQGAVNGFMMEMQAQFGVSPQQVVKAFAELDPASLASPPENVRESFLDNLGLEGAERAKAGLMYDEMARVTGEASMNERAASRELGAEVQIMTVSEDRLRRLNDSLDKLNDSFFLRGMPKDSPDPAAPQLAQNKSVKAPFAMPAMLPSVGPAAAAASVASSALTANGSATSAVVSGSGLAGMQAGADPVVSERVQATPPDWAAELEDAIQSGQSQSSPALEARQSAMRSVYAQKAKPEAAAIGEQVKKIATESAPADKAEALASSGSEGSAPLPTPALPTTAATTPAGAPAVAPFAMRMSPEDKEANVQEIMRQAQVIAKKGGGEMKLELRPEGIGHVNLKVSVVEGQVNVQMVTESNEAKRMLETGLQDLKSGLGSHKLQLEGLKIDSQENMQKQMDNSANRDAQREASRQFASDFMGGFRQEREAFRGAWADPLPVRSYRGSRGADVEAKSGSASRSQSSRRLNLVA